MRNPDPLGRFRNRPDNAAIRRRLDQLHYRRPRLPKPRFRSRSPGVAEHERDDQKAA
jgi:hypothetical protein